MPERNEQAPDQPTPTSLTPCPNRQPATPVADDATATAPQLLARAATDYAQERPNRTSREDRVNGQQTGSQH